MILQNVLFESEYCKAAEMFYRENSGEVSFDTYFNLFSYARWKEYTDLADLSLRIRTEGRGTVRFFDENRVPFLEAAVDSAAETVIRLPGELNCTVLYFVWQPADPADRVLSAAFETEDPARQPVRLAVDMCTYRREEFVRANAQTLSGIGDVSVYIVDNGKTLLPAEKENGQVKIFPNMNSGGSGGFTRGMLEVLKDREEKQLTHIVLMDDDVRFLPETFVRLKALLSLRTEKYADACVSGSFLNSEVSCIQVEGGTVWPDLTVYPTILNPDLDLRSFETAVRNEKEYCSDNAAWWFACYSLNTVRKDNLPLPFFIRMDDSEYGIRAGVPVVRLNGICVWHEPFENKKDSALYYYTVRNMLILNAVHGSAGSRGRMYRFCVRSMLSNLLRYRYKDMELVIKAVKDFLQGPGFFEKTDPAQYHQEIRGLGYRLENVRQLTDDPRTLREVETFDREKDLRQNTKRTAKYILTGNGWLLPAKKDRLYAFPLTVSQERLYRIGRVLFFDSASQKGMRAEKEFRQLFRFGWNCMRLLILFGGYEKTCRAFYAARADLTGEAFWKRYLRLDPWKEKPESDIQEGRAL